MGQGMGSGKPAEWDDRRHGAGAILLPDAIFDGRDLRRGVALRIGPDRLTADTPRADDLIWRVPGCLSPGFIDLQVNGGGGVLFNNRPDPEGLRAIARAHHSTGTAALLATLITDAPEVMERAVDAMLACYGRDGIAGIHLEGPHFSLARRGTHALRYIRPLDGQTLGQVARLRSQGVPVMLTLAPEATRPGQIAALVAEGVVVAIGHSDANADQVRAALAEGAQTFTHLFNAMSQMQNREPGVVGAAINSDAYCSMICDGIHVAPEMLALAIRARPRSDRMILVTDAMPTVAGPYSYTLYGQTIRLQDGRLLNQDGALAGAHVTMLQSVRFAQELLGAGLCDALRMAITNPAALMGFDTLGGLEQQRPEEVILIAPDMLSFTRPLAQE